MRRLPPLAALRAFEATARNLSFKRAALELHVTPTAISHQVRQLEAALGLRLFERRTRQVALTAAGQALLPALRDGFDAFAAAIDALTHRDRRSLVTLSATPAFIAKWLVPRIAGFRRERPDIDLALLASLDPVDVDAGAADLALRYGRGPYPDLVAELLVTDRFVPVASPRLGLKQPRDLRSVTLLHTDWRRDDPKKPTWRLWLKQAGLAGVDSRAGLRFSDETHAIQAAIAGNGVALQSLLLVAAELADGTLVAPFRPDIEGLAVHLIHSRKRPVTAPVEAVRSWLRQEMTEASPRRR